MIIGLLIILILIFVLPFVFHLVEHNLEYFLLFMGILATFISGTLSMELVSRIFGNYLLYFISAAVLIAGLIFRFSLKKLNFIINKITQKIPITLFVFLIIVILGLISSLITAIITTLLLVEIVHALPLAHKKKVEITIIACFSIGLGAALTPIGEPLATIVVSSLKVDFFYLLKNIGVFVIPGILFLGIVGALFTGYEQRKNSPADNRGEKELLEEENRNIIQMENLQSVFVRTLKIFLFVIALELLGTGFKPLINTYIIHMDSRILYWINMCSAVLDNATLAAAEVSPAMNLKQVQAILMGLLLSGGMLIPGNIPNIISAGKLNIKSKEWAKIGVPLGFVLLVSYYVIIFVIL